MRRPSHQSTPSGVRWASSTASTEVGATTSGRANNACALIGAMSSASYQSFLNASYNLVKTNSLLVGGAYYDESWTVMSLLMMTGNFLDYTQLTPAN